MKSYDDYGHEVDVYTPIDHYIDDALDIAIERDLRPNEVAPNEISEGYHSSRDVDEEPSSSITKDHAFRRRSFDPNGAEAAVPDSDGLVQVGVDGIEVELIQGINEDDFKKVSGHAIAGVVGRNWEEVNWEELLRGGLQTGLESQVLVFGVSGVSRACTHQIVRTRKAAYHQQSQRSSYYGPHPEVRIADSVWENPRARAAALRAIYFAHKAYETAIEEDISYQDSRLMLPEGTTNWILCEYPLRTFIDTYAYRACSMFQWEIVDVFRKMKKAVIAEHPWLEPYIKISCEKTSGCLDNAEISIPHGGDHRDHACTYQGHENVEEQCTFPWARETNRTFKPDKAHRIEKKG